MSYYKKVCHDMKKENKEASHLESKLYGITRRYRWVLIQGTRRYDRCFNCLFMTMYNV